MKRLVAQLAAVAGVLLVIVAGVWFWGAVVAPGFFTAIAFIVAWFLVIGVVTTRVGRRLPGLRVAMRGTYFATAAAAVLVGYLTSVRETEVNERVVTGTPASRLAPAPEPSSSESMAAPAPDVDALLAPQP